MKPNRSASWPAVNGPLSLAYDAASAAVILVSDDAKSTWMWNGATGTWARPVPNGFLLSSDLLPQLTTDTTTAEDREAGHIFLEGQGWGFGGSVDIAEIDPWNVKGRYGWVGGSGTAAHVVPTQGLITVLLTRTAMTSPTPTPIMRDFWRYAAR